MSFQSPRDIANQYLESKNVHRLFALLGSKIAVNKPEDVNAFILSELKTIQSNQSSGQRYSLFTSTDIESIFTAFDLTNKGYISQEQYITALTSVGKYKQRCGYVDM